jgi:hypothetical protein
MAYPNSIKSTGLVWTENDDKTQNDRDIWKLFIHYQTHPLEETLTAE